MNRNQRPTLNTSLGAQREELRSDDLRKRRVYLAASALLLCLMAFLLGFCGVACTRLTVAPKPVVARSVAFDGNEQNAGIINCDSRGCIVTPNWVAKYKALGKKLGQPIMGIGDPEGSNYRITYETFTHFAELKAAERGP